jgi:hypothetical protein
MIFDNRQVDICGNLEGASHDDEDESQVPGNGVKR